MSVPLRSNTSSRCATGAEPPVREAVTTAGEPIGTGSTVSAIAVAMRESGPLPPSPRLELPPPPICHSGPGLGGSARVSSRDVPDMIHTLFSPVAPFRQTMSGDESPFRSTT